MSGVAFSMRIMKKLGFCGKWVRWIAMCLEGTFHYVLQKGEKIRPIGASRGLRQGNTLSPFLFILCVEGLSYALQSL